MHEIALRIDRGRVLHLVTNDLAAPARQIADLHKRRWAIELFFPWIKQTLAITRFLGTGENAMRIQVAVAFIAFLMLRLARATQARIVSSLAFARLVRSNLMHRRSLANLERPPPRHPPDKRQIPLIPAITA